MVEVSTFETMAGDFLIIYDGLVADDGAVLATYEGTVTDAAPFTTTGPRMLVRFESDAAGVGRGFDLTWTQDYLGVSCSGVVTLDATSGSFSVLASPIGRYAAGTECTWHITGPAGTTLELSFPDVDLDDDDTVAVHDGVDNDAPIIGFFVSTTGALLVYVGWCCCFARNALARVVGALMSVPSYFFLVFFCVFGSHLPSPSTSQSMIRFRHANRGAQDPISTSSRADRT